ncbi:MAG: hypothetical protein NTW29_15305 [Bacteroidetes bacterium]|nr:hypothetical protein [Bacteroidota bacterium]
MAQTLKHKRFIQLNTTRSIPDTCWYLYATASSVPGGMENIHGYKRPEGVCT